jgi:hypothetical protein
MSKKIAGKVLASLALGGATLLIAPGIALAASDPSGGEWKGQDDKSYSHCEDWQDKKDSKGGHEEEAFKKDDGKKDEFQKDDEKKGEFKKDDDKCDSPKGWVDGGAGGVSTDATLATTGGALVGAAALGGLVLLRRRRTDGSVA